MNRVTCDNSVSALSRLLGGPFFISQANEAIDFESGTEPLPKEGCDGWLLGDDACILDASARDALKPVTVKVLKPMSATAKRGASRNSTSGCLVNDVDIDVDVQDLVAFAELVDVVGPQPARPTRRHAARSIHTTRVPRSERIHHARDLSK